MGKIFSENEYNDILEKCREFKKLFLDTSEKEVYVQLVRETDSYDGIQVTFDIYPKKFLGRLMDYVFSPNRSPIPLFSYCFETNVVKNSFVYKDIKGVAQRNNGWLEAKLCDETEYDCDFYGQLVWQCGDVEHSNVGIKMQYGISSSAMQTINRTIAGFEKKPMILYFLGIILKLKKLTKQIHRMILICILLVMQMLHILLIIIQKNHCWLIVELKWM